MKLPPLVAIKFKEIVLERAHQNAKAIQWTQGGKRAHEDIKQPLQLDEKRARSSDDADIQTFTMTAIREIYGGHMQTFYWRHGDVARVLIQPKHQPRAPAEIFVSEPEQFKVGMVFPEFIWRQIHRWEYVPALYVPHL